MIVVWVTTVAFIGCPAGLAPGPGRKESLVTQAYPALATEWKGHCQKDGSNNVSENFFLGALLLLARQLHSKLYGVWVNSRLLTLRQLTKGWELDGNWTGTGRELDRNWTGTGQELDGNWTGTGRELDGN
jgi:hypothetical protein